MDFRPAPSHAAIAKASHRALSIGTRSVSAYIVYPLHSISTFSNAVPFPTQYLFQRSTGYRRSTFRLIGWGMKSLSWVYHRRSFSSVQILLISVRARRLSVADWCSLGRRGYFARIRGSAVWFLRLTAFMFAPFDRRTGSVSMSAQ